MKRRLFGVLGVLALLLAACGGDGGEKSRDNGTENTERDTSSEDDVKDLSESTLELASLPEPLLADDEANDSEDLRIVWAVAPTSLDPHTEFEAFVGLGYDTLLMFDHQRQLMPGVAEDFDVSEDDLTITFYLRDGLAFSDGTDVDAEAVRASIERAQEFPESKYKSVLADIESIETPSSDVVEIQLSKPNSNVILGLAGPAGAIINPTAIEDDVDLGSMLAGSTPLDVVDFDPGTSITYKRDAERAENYYDPAAFRYETVSIVESVDRSAILNGLQSGSFDLALFGGPTEQAEGQLGDDFIYSALRADSARSLWLNARDDSALEDVEIRQAIVQAIDRGAIGGNIIARCEPMTQLARSGTAPYIDDFDPFPFDPEAAAAVLEDKDITLNLVTSTNPDEVAAATAMQQYLGDVGVNVDIEEMPIVEGQQAFASNDLGYFNAAPKADLSLSIESLWLNPPFQVADSDLESEIGGLIEDVSAASLGSEEREEALHELNRSATEMAVQVPICGSSSLWVAADDVVGSDTMQNGWLSQFGPRYIMFRG